MLLEREEGDITGSVIPVDMALYQLSQSLFFGGVGVGGIKANWH